MKSTLLDKWAELSGIVETGQVRINRGWRSADGWQLERSIESTDEMDTMNFSWCCIK